MKTIEGTLQKPKNRVHAIDEIRGLALLSMLAFHFCYDLAYLTHVPLDFFRPPLQTIWQLSIALTFIFISGMSNYFSKNHTKRVFKLLIAAAIVSLGTYIASVDTWVRFGIIHCLVACSIIQIFLSPILEKFDQKKLIVIFLILFLLSYEIPNGSFGVGALSINLPEFLYDQQLFAWLGFPNDSFVSGDYYPVIPYVFLYLSSASTCKYFKDVSFPEWMMNLHFPSLSYLGKNTLIIYLLHQPIFIGILIAFGLL